MVQSRDYTIGVYYFPRWSPYSLPQEPDAWWEIKPYPEREPLLGWYNDGERATMDRQLGWMADYGIDFVTFDWYWENENGRPATETAVNAYLQSPVRTRVHYALLWAGNKAPTTLPEWDKLVDYWIKRHLGNPEYLRIDGKPALFVFSPDNIRDQATKIGIKLPEMLDRARARAKAAGLPGIYFVVSVPATDYWVLDFAPKSGFDALNAYNYHFGLAGDKVRTANSHSFAELDSDYQMQWKWILENSRLPYFVPMTSGWDKRPWGGSGKDPLHDNSVSTPDSFEQHLLSARAMIRANATKTKGIGMVCCWNEYGEGSYMEPTKRFKLQYLERLKKVFGVGAPK